MDSTGTTYLIQDGSGDSVTAAVNSTASTKYINASLGLGRWPEPVQGLVANAAGNTNPTAIQARTGGVLTAPYAFSQFYGTYGNELAGQRETGPAHRLRPSAGQSNPGNTFYVKNLSAATARHARGICQSDGVKAATLLGACTIDEAVLGKKAPRIYRSLPTNVTVGQISPPKGTGDTHSSIDHHGMLAARGDRAASHAHPSPPARSPDRQASALVSRGAIVTLLVTLLCPGRHNHGK